MSHKIFYVSICMLLIICVSSIETIQGKPNEEVNPINRPFYLKTSGTIKSTLFILHMFEPWPDQTYFTLFGLIFYKNGNTTITNTNTGKTYDYEGEHIVMFYKFLGPVSDANGEDSTVTFEGNAVVAVGVGG